ncbi:Imm32 family immunity protein [Rhodanobacter glycinis]|uniref:Uncharacterized protein n=1 Tax=Rhodanobacter glycinis TaxID=582702 RepID=A0A1I3ZM61_9GAMM|nr:hypothetical protein [Rhodanobacter glycinis]SFK45142.1 hypothetical protein SAMN05192579_10313 [Rhodanobacter glycinis]
MKLFGYLASASEQQAPSELSEATLLASPAELREIAGFMLHAADSMEHTGASFNHMHLSDMLRQFEKSPAFIVAVGESAQAG